MNIRIRKFVTIIFSLFVFAFSLHVFDYFNYGDQYHYINYYNKVSQLGIVEAYFFYKESLSTSEPVYFLLTYFSSKFIQKDILFSVINSIFTYVIFSFLNEKKVSYKIQVFLLFNYYLVVLFFSAERLKVGLLILFLSINCKFFLKYTLSLISFFTHVQIFLLIIQPFLVNILNFIKDFRISLRDFLVAIVVFFIVCIALILMSSHIFEKLEHYNGDLYSIIKPLVFMIFSVICAEKRKLIPFFQGLIFVFASYLVGDERVVIFSYFVFMWYGVNYKRGYNIYVFITSIYFFIKGIIFLYNIYNFGDGFSSEHHLY